MIAFAAMMLSGTSAFAAGIFFQTASVAATAICPAPCFQVQMFAQDDSPGGTRVIQAIQFDVNVVNANAAGQITSDVVVANLPVPPATNSNAAAGNTNIEDIDGNIAVIPFELSATVGKSPTQGQDVRVVEASAFPTSVSALKAIRDRGVGCPASALCSIQLAGLNRGRIYLGRFNMSGVTADTAFIYSNATGNGELVTGFTGFSGLYSDGSQSYIAEGSRFPVGCRLGPNTGCLADRELFSGPEPASMLLVGAALLGLSLFRRRT